ncbi:MAG: hypothetical protein ACRDH7_10335 [Actinomycetota bacterium]
MSESPRARTLRAGLAVILAILYGISVLSFWLAGAIAYLEGFHGPARFLGFAYVPSLLLPIVGRGEIAGIDVRSPVWVWWFVVQLALAFGAVWIYPHEHVSRRALRQVSPRAVRPRIPT